MKNKKTPVQNKKTAVQFLYEKMILYIPLEYRFLLDDSLIESAEIERQQIIDACIYGNGLDYYDARKIEGEKYYKQTFDN